MWRSSTSNDLELKLSSNLLRASRSDGSLATGSSGQAVSYIIKWKWENGKRDRKGNDMKSS